MSQTLKHKMRNENKENKLKESKKVRELAYARESVFVRFIQNLQVVVN